MKRSFAPLLALATLAACGQRVIGRAVEAGQGMGAIYQAPGPSESPSTSNAYRAGLQGLQPPGYADSAAVAPIAAGEERAALNGTSTISITHTQCR
jgi:hypothetical protein